MAQSTSGIGQETIEINRDNFKAGMSDSTYSYDAGYASAGDLAGTIVPSTVNLTAQEGILFPPGPVTDESIGDLTDLLIASTGAVTSGAILPKYEATFVSSDAKFYSWNGSTLTHKGTDATANRDYTFGKTSMVNLGFSVFTSSSSSVANNVAAVRRWTLSSDAFADAFNFTNDLAPHPGILYEDQAYWADGDLLLRQTDETDTTPDTVLDLADTAIITALGIDPGSGNMLIATTTGGVNMSDTSATVSKILTYDGFSNKPLSAVIVDDQVTAFYSLGGITYVGYGNKLGYWNGSGIQFLRTLDLGSSPTFTELPYPAHFTNIDNTLYVVERRNILAYGEIHPGVKVFYYVLQNNNGDSGNFSLISNVGSKNLGLSFATDKFYTFSTTSTATVTNGGAQFWTNRYEFKRPVTFNNVIVEFLEPITASANILTVNLYDDTGRSTPTSLGTITTDSSNNSNLYELPYPSVKTRSIQLRLTWGGGVVPTGIRRILITYNDYD